MFFLTFLNPFFKMRRLDYKTTKELLSLYEIPMVKGRVFSDKKEALRWAEKIGWPVVLKTASSEIIHRTEREGVKTGIKAKEELEEAWEKLQKMGEVLVQKEIKGRQLVVGMKRDKTFGPVLLFGLGGILMEVLEDVAFRAAPLKKDDALEMIREIKGFKVLKGFRGKDPVDLEALADILVKLSKLSLKEDEVKEIDFNPVMSTSEGAEIVDTKILI